MNRFIGKWMRSGIEHFGYTLTRTGSESLHNRLFADHIITLFGKLDISCVIDVGANKGQYRNFLRNDVGYKGLIISFEPIKKNIDILISQAQKDPRWLINGYALGNENTRLNINVTKSDVFSSFLNPENVTVTMFRDENVVDHRELVEVKRLDYVMPMLQDQHGIHNIYLKMDTQGFDLKVVDGAAEMLSKVIALQMELSIRRLYEGMPSYLDVLQAMTDKGFDITGFYPVTRDEYIRVIEFDCVMINTAYTRRLAF